MNFISKILKKLMFNLKFLIFLHYKNLKLYLKPTKKPYSEPIKTNSIHWVGHATTVINLYDNLIITDPVIGSLAHFKRITKPSLNLKDLGINYMILSHGHMDHIDFMSLLRLNKNVTVICPKDYSKLLKLIGYKDVIGLSSGEEFVDDNINIKCFKSNHDGRRYYIGHGYNSNAYLITSKDKKIFFAGDTAYTEDFKDLECDMALMPVGCYLPIGFDKMHCTPEQSFNMFKMMKGKAMIPIHYNTFILSLEENEDTLKVLKNINDGRINIIDIGQTINI